MFLDFEEPTFLATTQEAVREWACVVGANKPDVPWLLSDYDTWERNPYYRGPPVSHPEDDVGYFDEDTQTWKKA